MKWQVHERATDIGTTDALVVFVDAEGSTGGAIDAAAAALVRAAREEGLFPARRGEVTVLRPVGSPTKRLLLVQVGEMSARSRPGLARAAAAGIRTARQDGARTVAIALPDDASQQDALCIAAGAAGGAYQYTRYKSEAGSRRIDSIALVTGGSYEGLLERVQAVSEGQSVARDLVNLAPQDKFPEDLARRIEELGREWGFEVEVFDRHKLTEMGAGGLLGVGQGSEHPPVAVVMRYGRGKGQPIGLLGKGMTFDSGGLSLKTASGMETMKSDMAGAAAVIGAMVSIARLKPDGAVTGVVTLAENMPSGSAIRPGDVLTMLSGKTVEVLNTDAEGRLVLADGLEILRREKVSCAVDLATLTGACVIALGNVRAGYLATDDDLAARLEAASARSGERIWRMPTDEEYREQLDSPLADIKNTGGRGAGMITGGLFIGDFRGELPWAHLDVAGVTFRESASSPWPAGGTGFGVGLLVELAAPSL